MALTFEQETALEELKQKNRVELVEVNGVFAEGEHRRKMERLEKTKEIAEKGFLLKGGTEYAD